jgi:hypothetical protein
LEKIKPVFILAETDIPEQQKKVVDMSYGWKFHHLMNDICTGQKEGHCNYEHFNWVDSVLSRYYLYHAIYIESRREFVEWH